MSFGSSSSSSKPMDMTPAVFKNLQGPYADVFASLLGYAPGSSGGTATPSPGTAPQMNQPTSGNSRMVGVQNNSAGNPALSPGAQKLARYAGVAPQTPAYTPVGNPNDPTRGIPQYQGPLVAGLGANEQTLLDMLMQTAGAPTPGQAELQNIASGAGVPQGQTPQSVNDFVNQLGVGYTPQGSLGDFMSELAGASGTGAFGADSPFLQAYIEAAQRPTMQALEETLSRTLPGRFTQAGHIVQPQGSSAFDRAAAIASRGATQEMGDIATRISYQALEAARGREAAALESELGRRGEYGEAGRAREAAAKEAELGRGQESKENALNRQLEAASQLPAIQRQQVDTMIANLQAQALPRLIEQLGIENGMEQFQNRLNTLIATLGIGAGVTAPVIGTQNSQSGFQMGIK